MSGEASAQAREAPSEKVATYDELEALLDELLEEALQKVRSGRVYDAENERVRIKWIRIAKDVVAEKRKVVNDRTLEELTERVEMIEAAQEGQQ
jgi:hypothetical protein